jgi:hypothetical protein
MKEILHTRQTPLKLKEREHTTVSHSKKKKKKKKKQQPH